MQSFYLHPGTSVSGVVEVTDVDGPDGDADEGDDLEGGEENKFLTNNFF